MNEWNERLKEALDMVHMEQSVKISTLDRLTKKQEYKKNIWNPIAAVMCMCCLIIACWGIHLVALPVRYISIDINPSIELGVNVLDRVVRVAAYNDDGKKLTDQLPLLFLSSTEAVQTVVDSEDIQNLLGAKEELMLTVVDESETSSQELVSRLEETVGKAANVCCRGVASLDVEQAHSKGMSYGKYLAYREVVQNDIELTIEDAQKMTMKEIRSMVKPSLQTTVVDTADTDEYGLCNDNSQGHRQRKRKHGCQ